jgi:undecaprenyl diphosphate synthase
LSQDAKTRSLPRHIAIIMDGNGRWAKARGLSRSEGHRAGVRAIEPIVRACGDRGIEALTLYAFSTENWKRPRDEVSTLMDLMREFFTLKLPAMIEAGVRIRVLGDRAGVPTAQRMLIERAESMTQMNTGISLNIAFNYGGRAELVTAAKSIARKAAKGEIDPESVDESAIERELYTRDLPPLDLLIRTSGEMRVSNFLLYQLAYAEMSFIDECWPDFSEAVLARELARYSNRERRFGGLST